MTKAERLARLHGLYGIVDDGERQPLAPFDWATALSRGGARIIQLRFKRTPMGEALAMARRIRAALPDVALVINDRPDLALLADADGVHLGEHDISVVDARRILGPERLVGATARTSTDAQARLTEGADHLGVGPVFVTTTKNVDFQPLGIEGLRAICRAISAPVIAIAGIGLDNIESVAKAGARAAAVVSAVGSASNPEAAARALTHRFFEGAA